MSIRARLFVCVIGMVLAEALLGTVLFQAGRRVNDMIGKSRLINEIVKGVFELNILTSDYLLFHGERARMQWKAKHTSLAAYLGTAPFSTEREQSVLGRVRLKCDSIGLLFAELANRYERPAPSPGTEVYVDDARDRLAAQITIDSQSMVYDSLNLAKFTQSNIIRVSDLMGLLILAVMLVTGVLLSTMVFIIATTIIRPLAHLQRGTELLAAGDLDHRVPVVSRNELGRLAEAFNAMALKMQTSFRELEVEVRERQRAERELAEEKDELTVTLNSIGDGVITANSLGRVRMMNPVAQMLTGWTAAEALGKPLAEVFNVREVPNLNPARQKQEVKPGEPPHLAKPQHRLLTSRDGRERPILESQAPIESQQSGLTGIAVVFRDITEQASLEREANRIQRLESVGVLAGGIAHDFNNILTAILGNLSLATFDMNPADPAYALIKEAEKASSRAKKLTQQLLTFSKGGSPVKTTAYIEDLLRESADFAMRGSNVGCEFHIDPGLWTAEVDTGQFSQVIQNLVINAKQAMPGGGTIQVIAENLIADGKRNTFLRTGKYLKITVADQGVGIPPENLDKIFDPYFSTKPEGSGLGLAIIHSIVMHHGGHISVESTVGVGSRFHVYLPANPVTVIRPPRQTEEVPEAPRVGRGKILVMDDEKVIGRIAGRMLNRLGYRFEIAVSGEHAIEKFLDARSTNHPFDLVILDLTIRGGMGGKDVIRTLLEIDSGICAIVSSGYSNDPIMAHYRDFGFKGVIVKPYKFETLRDTIEKHLARPTQSG